MKISIIIPIYNVEQYVERCLNSAFNQTYQDIEYIIVNDCTQDNSMNIVAKTISHFEKNIKVIHHEKNKGLSEARNTGIRVATGDYVYFLDSDDEITNNCIEILVRESDGYEIILGEFISNPSDKSLLKNKKNTFEDDEIKIAYFNELIYVTAWNKLIDRKFLLSNNLFFEPGLIHEDYLWTFFLLMACKKLKIIEEVTYIYYIRGGSLGTNFTIKNVDHHIIGFNKIENYLINNADIGAEKYEYLIKNKYRIKNMAIYMANISLSEFKNLAFSTSKYPFPKKNYLCFMINCLLRFPFLLQYGIVKCKIIIYSILKIYIRSYQ
jgi:glycosyltransferase involved in cell wall biosynthesis